MLTVPRRHNDVRDEPSRESRVSEAEHLSAVGARVAAKISRAQFSIRAHARIRSHSARNVIAIYIISDRADSACPAERASPALFARERAGRQHAIAAEIAASLELAAVINIRASIICKTIGGSRTGHRRPPPAPPRPPSTRLSPMLFVRASV